MRRKEERSKQSQINKKAKQHSTPKAVTFPKNIELPCVHVHACTERHPDPIILWRVGSGYKPTGKILED